MGNDNNALSYSELEQLLSTGGWSLSKGIKDNWNVNRHLSYIENVTNHRIEIIGDSNILELSQRVDVFVSGINQDSRNEHIQFVKMKRIP